MAEQANVEKLLAQKMGEFFYDPLGYVMFNFPWKSDPAIQMVKLKEPWATRYPEYEYGPDAWACEFLDDLGKEIRKRNFNGRHAVDPIRFSTSSGHGIGKSTLVAWLILFILDTRPFSMGVVTANTGDQLRTKTWAELAKWHHIALTSHLWVYSNSRGSMSLYRRGDKAISQKWRCDAMTARAENSEAFQGLHAANSTPFYIFDEASGIDNAIWESRFGGATDGEPMSFDFGNPTRKSGYFYENCIGMYRHRYNVRQIDSRDVEITNKRLMEDWRQDWGEDSDLFKVKVRGVFPSAGSVQFIGTDLVEDAMVRPAIHSEADPLVIGVDVARFGDNDTIIFPRIGNDARSFPFKRFNGLDGPGVAEKVIETIQEFAALGRKPNGIFIDGGGLGAGPVDILTRLGYPIIDVNFGSKAVDPKYRRKGDEMWGKMRAALDKTAIPLDQDLKAQLTQREYNVTDTGKIQLESKQIMMDRGVQSPDIADALALTYHSEISPDSVMDKLGFQPRVDWDYNPLEAKW